MAEKIKLVRNDTKPYIVLSLTDQNTGNAIDISTATTKMYFRAAGTSTVFATLTAAKIAGVVQSDGTVNSVAPYNTPGVGGRCQFLWGSGDLNQPAGDYEGEVEITFADGTKETLYDLLKFKIREDFNGI